MIPGTVLLAGVVAVNTVRPCGTCGATDRYPSGPCRPCTQRRGAAATASGYWKNRALAQRASALDTARTEYERQGVIYGLFDPAGALRYIGQTQAGTRRRLAGHLCGFKGPHDYLPVNRWIAKLAAAGQEPEMRVLAGPMHAVDLDDAEREHIAATLATGGRLLNVHPGGATPIRKRGMPPDAIKRSADAKRGKPRSAATKAKLSAANRGRKQDPGVVARRNATNRGRKQSPEWIAKRVAAIAATKAAKAAVSAGVTA